MRFQEVFRFFLQKKKPLAKTSAKLFSDKGLYQNKLFQTLRVYGQKIVQVIFLQTLNKVP